MIHIIFGGVAWLCGLRILDPKYRLFGILMLTIFLLLAIFMWLEQAGSTHFSGVWTREFGFFLLTMLGIGILGLLAGILMRIRPVPDVRTD